MKDGPGRLVEASRYWNQNLLFFFFVFSVREDDESDVKWREYHEPDPEPSPSNAY